MQSEQMAGKCHKTMCIRIKVIPNVFPFYFLFLNYGFAGMKCLYRPLHNTWVDKASVMGVAWLFGTQ